MDVDSRLILIFHEIYKNKSVSKAASHLGITQPTLSIGLNKLRKHFNNPLFIRVGNLMEPTELAKELYPITLEFLKNLKLINSYNLEFNPNTSNYSFKICMTDISHLILLPKLIIFLRTNAPNIRFQIVPIDEDTPNKMADGEIDLAIGFIPQLDAGFYQQTLFKQNYTVICSPNHPRLNKNSFTIEDFSRELHIDVSATGGHYIIHNELQKKGITRNILMQLPNYLGVGPIIKHTDAIATIPMHLGNLMQSRGDVILLPPPISFPEYSVKQHWHARSHNNLSVKWLRKVCYELFSN